MRAFLLQAGKRETIIAARTAIEAVLYHQTITGLGFKDFQPKDDIRRIPAGMYKHININNQEFKDPDDIGVDKPSYTLEELMKNVTEPEIICFSGLE